MHSRYAASMLRPEAIRVERARVAQLATSLLPRRLSSVWLLGEPHGQRLVIVE